MDLTFAAATDVGKQRNHNEDNFLIDKKIQLFIVADGMGGHAAGEVASSITVHQIRDAMYTHRDRIDRFRSGDAEVTPSEILQLLEQSIQDACGTVYGRAQAETDKRGMGTTASVLLVAGPPGNLRGFIAHVGDSRIYLTRAGQTHQLTEDHSLMNELIRRGKIRREEFDASPYKHFKNAVTRAVGVYQSVEVDTFDFDILPGDRFLLCTDGLYAYLEEPTLPELLSENTVETVPKKLIEKANDGGGHDNITSVVVRVGDQNMGSDVRSTEVAAKIDVLKGMQMFRYLSYRELVRVMNIADTVDFPVDGSVFSEGEKGDAMYVVLTGQIRLHKGAVTVTELTRGQHFGEMALVDRTQRSLSATAAEASKVMVIRRKDFYTIIKEEPNLSVKLLWSFVQVLAERLRKTTSELSGVLATEDEPTLSIEIEEGPLDSELP